MSKNTKRPVIDIPSVEEDRTIAAAANADPDAPPMTLLQLREMKPYSSIRGRPRSDNAKKLVSVRYSPEVIAFFRSTGEGWQARMDEVLKEYVLRNSKA